MSVDIDTVKKIAKDDKSPVVRVAASLSLLTIGLLKRVEELEKRVTDLEAKLEK